MKKLWANSNRKLGDFLQSMCFSGPSFLGMRFAQVSCFLPADQTKTESDIQSFHQTLDAEMVTASLTAPEGGSLYDDAWSGKATLSIDGQRGSVSVKTLGVGGDFFLFHPLVLRSGAYLSAKDFMPGQSVIY